MFFGIVIAIAGFLAFVRFREIERDGRKSVEAAKGHSDEARKLVDEIREIKKGIVAEAKKISKIKETIEEDAARVKELRVTTAESVAQAPDRANLAIADVTGDPEASAMD